MTHPTDDELQDLAHSAYEEALSFGLSVDTFLRYFKGIRNRLATQAQGQDAAPAERDALQARELRAWQAAIQHARDVAVRACESRIMGDHNREDQEAQRCADAIKEALK